MVSFACYYSKNVDTKLNENQDPNEGRQLNGLLLNTLYVEVYIFNKSSYSRPALIEMRYEEMMYKKC